MHGKKILLVEDSPLLQMIVKALLDKLDCVTDIANTGEDSVALCIQNHYDLILMDIGLPGIDGIMAAQLIREQENPQHHVPIIALTAHNDAEMKAKALRAGMDDYLIKPFTQEVAQRVLAQYCDTATTESLSNIHRKRN